MLSLAHALDLLAHKLARLRAWRLALALVTFGILDCL